MVLPDRDAVGVRLEVVDQPVGRQRPARASGEVAGSPPEVPVAEPPLGDGDGVVLLPDMATVVEHRHAVGIQVGGIVRFGEEALVVLAERFVEGGGIGLWTLVPERELARLAPEVRFRDAMQVPDPRPSHGSTSASAATMRSPARPSHSSGTRAPLAALRRAAARASTIDPRPASTFVPS